MTPKNISKCFHYFQSLVTRHVPSRDHLEKRKRSEGDYPYKIASFFGFVLTLGP